MRTNFTVMRDVAIYTRQGPVERVRTLKTFITRMGANEAVDQDMQAWGMRFARDLVQVNGRELGPEKIHQGKVDVSGTW